MTLSGIEQNPCGCREATGRAVVLARGGEAQAQAALVEITERASMRAVCLCCAWQELEGDGGWGGAVLCLRLGSRSSRFGENRFTHEASAGGECNGSWSGAGAAPSVVANGA